MLFGLVLVLLTIAGCTVFVLRPAWFPLPISAEAILYDRQFRWTLWITGIIFIAVQLLLAWTVLRGRRASIASARSHRTLEISWTVATAALFLTLAGIGSHGREHIGVAGDLFTGSLVSHSRILQYFK